MLTVDVALGSNCWETLGKLIGASDASGARRYAAVCLKERDWDGFRRLVPDYTNAQCEALRQQFVSELGSPDGA